MDERIKETYRKIYAELFVIVLFACCISMLIKFIFLHRSMPECILEFLILTGSPVYMAVRTRMLGVTQVPFFQNRSRLRRRTGLAAGLLTALLCLPLSAVPGMTTRIWFLLPYLALPFSLPFCWLSPSTEKQKKNGRKSWIPGTRINHSHTKHPHFLPVCFLYPSN